MKTAFLATFLAAIPAWVSAVMITNTNFDGVEAGKAFEVTWSDATGPVTLTLKDGPAENLNTVGEITSGETGESYTWIPDSSLPSGTYAIEISDGTDVNYSKQFDIAGGSASSSSAISTTSATSTSTVVSSTTASSTTSSASSTSSSASSSTSSGSITSSASSSTSSASKTSAASSSTSATVAPNTNAAQTAAPFVAPLLLALGAAFI
ncbi:Ser-Thr-rich glycosyl-phosphatidyl-inositol-anchored membrane family-domain-containing protein [Hypoxylon rubiginosum]|uniref:Ser-Thr-rich glycosyl-phosphatidyl-inositol-anchored membrane family-domain-containing protein n=1 Tax=Hypoxylon rubiginosum TaxID=110542 RepID=A0ACC0DKZ4_9PEZI|nr:Ser-Thr-rich glycosyl-phosphatidyl-inositol-anchored membrane family-domain-containing protein [Hypoxylon rubiginosum]